MSARPESSDPEERHDALTARGLPRCVECCAVWLPSDNRRWRAYLPDDLPPVDIVLYCPTCAEREFGCT